MNYYNEWDPYAAQWLRNLISAGLIPKGDVDERSIGEVQADDLGDYTQCHFFAGIGGWSLALQLAGWDPDCPVWTGSCPCQPFSVAGLQRGFADDRDLWPVLSALIGKCSPPVVFGEQVASSAQWISRMRSDLEGLDYAVGGCPIEAASSGAPQFRDRFWFVAVGDLERARDLGIQRGRQLRRASSATEDPIGVMAGGSDSDNLSAGHGEVGSSGELAPKLRPGLEERQGITGDDEQKRPAAERNGLQLLERAPGLGWGEGWTEDEFRRRGFTAAVASLGDGTQFVECPDGKFRRLPPPGVRWLGNGIPARVAKLRGFGNAIVPQAAAEFIGAFMDTTEGVI